MNEWIGILAGALCVLMLAWIVIPSTWLDRHARLAGRVAEAAAWLGLGAAGAGYVLQWVVLRGDALVFGLNGADLVGVRLDALSGPVLLLVGLLGGVILRFSRNYLAGDKRQGYFIKWISITLGAVHALVLAPGLVQFLLAWTLTSLGLHKLLVYFPDRAGTLLSARKKFVVSRAGDICLIVAFFGLFNLWGVQDFEALFAAAANETATAAPLWIGLLIVMGALLKSAQFPFHTWLPDTMGTPTPVSALMHAGIINAGGYLVVRLSPILVQTPSALHILAVAGAITAIFGAVVMLTQTSIKRALAYSTIAQMGFMLLQCGLGAFNLAILHLIAHSIYKAHAFLSSGDVIRSLRILPPRNPVRDSNFASLTAILIAAAGIVIAAAYVFDLRPSDKPGMLVLATVLILALTQFLAARVQMAPDRASIAIGLLGAMGLAALYFSLALASAWVLQPVLPPIVPTAPWLEWILALALFGVLSGALLIQTSSLRPAHPGWLDRIYVHALNGFYFNTIANRCARLAGLVPRGR